MTMPNRLLTINIRKYLSGQPVRKRHARLSRYVRHRIAQQTNIKSDNIKISKELNSIIMKRYLYSMTPLKVNISIEKDKATVTHFDSKPKETATVAKDKTSTKTSSTEPAKTPEGKKQDSKKDVQTSTAGKELKK